MRAVLFSMPEDVERFEPVLRRCHGAEALLSPGRFLPATRDSRALVRAALRERGWLPRERATRAFDRILTTTRVAPSAVAAWLAPGGRAVLWHDPAIASRWEVGVGTSSRSALQPEIAAVAAPTAACLTGVHPEHATAVGDPLLDVSFETGAAARGRAALGLSGDRPVLVVALDAIPEPRWAAAIAALRAEADVVLLVADALWLAGDGGRWPRTLTGPGLYLVGPAGLCRRAEALALADCVVARPGALLDAARRRGRRTLVLADRRHDGPLPDAPVADRPDGLHAAVLEGLRDTPPVAAAGPGAARRLAAVLDAAVLDLAAL